MVNGHLAQILFIKKWIDSVGEGIQTQQYGRNLFKISLSVVEVLRETSVAVSPVESTSVVSASSLAFFIASIFLYNGKAQDLHSGCLGRATDVANRMHGYRECQSPSTEGGDTAISRSYQNSR